jgi:hypothetical protein
MRIQSDLAPPLCRYSPEFETSLRYAANPGWPRGTGAIRSKAEADGRLPVATARSAAILSSGAVARDHPIRVDFVNLISSQ